MKISEVVSKLTDLQHMHGDIEVALVGDSAHS